MITKRGSTKIVNFMTPDDGVLMLRCSYISHYREFHYLKSTLSICSTFNGLHNTAFYAIVDFYLFNDGASDMSIL